MTTYVPFVPSNNATPPFTANVVLDGKAYQLKAVWNFAAQRWYISLAQQNQSPVWYGPLLGSPLNSNIYLAPSVFQNSTILYRTDTGNFEINP